MVATVVGVGTSVVVKSVGVVVVVGVAADNVGAGYVQGDLQWVER